MQDSLDIFDVAHGHPVAEQELAVLVEEGELLSRCQNRLHDLNEAYQDLLAQYRALSLQCEEKDNDVVILSRGLGIGVIAAKKLLALSDGTVEDACRLYLKDSKQIHQGVLYN